MLKPIFVFFLGFVLFAAETVQAIETSFSKMGRLTNVLANEYPSASQVEIELRKKHYPVVIFIPGILGSRLIRIDPTTRKSEQLWGRVSLRLKARDLFYEQSDTTVVPKILDSFDAQVFRKDVYGSALLRIKERQSSDVQTLELFPYDWRQDNRVSAEALNTWLCNKKANLLKNRRIVFIAHSMGGLVLKKWLKDHHKDGWCRVGVEKLNVEKVVFLGTPHYGSPKSIRSFASGFTLAAGSRTIFGRIFGDFDKRTLSHALNVNGPSFPSVYQLLPIYRKRCARHHQELRKLPPPVVVKHPEPTDDIDVFAIETWRRYGWPKQLPQQWTRAIYYEKILPKFLQNAQSFLCELAKYNLEQSHPSIAFTYIFGVNLSEANTEVSYELTEKSDWSGNRSWDIRTDKYRLGDGTVPRSIASDQWRADLERLRRADQTYQHEELLNSSRLQSFVSSLFRQAQINFDRDTTSELNTYRDVFIENYKVQRVLPTVPSDPNVLKRPEYKGVQSALAEIQTHLNVSGRRVFDAALAAKDNERKLDLYAVAAASESTPPVFRAWALNNLSLEEFRQKDYVRAKESARESRFMAVSLPGMQKDLIAKATNTEAWAKLNLGKTDQAKTLFEIAIQQGSTKAKIGLDYLASEHNRMVYMRGGRGG